jgi:uncharacterized repeat protein (TIGR02543 family)
MRHNKGIVLSLLTFVAACSVFFALQGGTSYVSADLLNGSGNFEVTIFIKDANAAPAINDYISDDGFDFFGSDIVDALYAGVYSMVLTPDSDPLVDYIVGLQIPLTDDLYTNSFNQNPVLGLADLEYGGVIMTNYQVYVQREFMIADMDCDGDVLSLYFAFNNMNVFDNPDNYTVFVVLEFDNGLPDYAAFPDNPDTCTITFNTDGGSSISPLTVNYNATPTMPASPTKTGNTFAGWYKDSLLTQAYINAPVTASFTLYAKWIEVLPDIYTVTFMVDGEVYCVASVPYGAILV